MKLNQATAAAFLSVSTATLASSSLVASTAPYDKLKDKIASLSLLHPSPIFYTYTGHRMLQEFSDQCSTDLEAGTPTFKNAFINAMEGCALAQSATQEDTASVTAETDFSACGSSLFAEACTEDKGTLLGSYDVDVECTIDNLSIQYKEIYEGFPMCIPTSCVSDWDAQSIAAISSEGLAEGTEAAFSDFLAAEGIDSGDVDCMINNLSVEVSSAVAPAPGAGAITAEPAPAPVVTPPAVLEPDFSDQCSIDLEAGVPTFKNALNNAFNGCALAQSETQEDTAPTTVETDFSACGSSLFAEACTEDKGTLLGSYDVDVECTIDNLSIQYKEIYEGFPMCVPTSCVSDWDAQSFAAGAAEMRAEGIEAWLSESLAAEGIDSGDVDCMINNLSVEVSSAVAPAPGAGAITAEPAPAPVVTLSTEYRICGLNYTDVLENCNTNPTCPTGDSCPAGFVCYQLNEDLCPRPTSVVTPPAVLEALTTAKPSQSSTLLTVASTTPNRFFCATSWEVVDETCSTATPCPNGQQDCTTAGMTCYQIQADKCVRKSTSSPTVGAILTSAPSPSSGSSFASKAPTLWPTAQPMLVPNAQPALLESTAQPSPPPAQVVAPPALLEPTAEPSPAAPAQVVAPPGSSTSGGATTGVAEDSGVGSSTGKANGMLALAATSAAAMAAALFIV